MSLYSVCFFLSEGRIDYFKILIFKLFLPGVVLPLDCRVSFLACLFLRTVVLFIGSYIGIPGKEGSRQILSGMWEDFRLI